MSVLKSSLKNLLNRTGWNIVRDHNNPEKTLLGLRNRNIRTIVDVGANVGQSAKYYLRLFPNATIYCFEPLPKAYMLLDDWAKKQGGKVKTFNVALGNKIANEIFFEHLDHSPSSSLLKTTNTTLSLYPKTKNKIEILVNIDRLDNYVNQIAAIPDIFVKMDVQGYELEVILGGERVLESVVGCIIEVGLIPLYDGQSSYDEIIQKMYQLGFRYAGNLKQACDIDGRVFAIDALFLKEK